MSQTLWACPNGCPSVRGPSKPRRNATCRVCLTCSASSPKLVERTAPALERKRELRTQKLVAKKAELKQKSAEQLAAYYTVAGVNLLTEMRAALKCAVFKGMKEPELIVRTRRVGGTHHVRGRCWYGHHRILVNRIDGLSTAHHVSTLLHELAHLKAGPMAGHDVAWKTTFRLACEQHLGVRPRVENAYTGREVAKLVDAANAPPPSCSACGAKTVTERVIVAGVSETPVTRICGNPDCPTRASTTIQMAETETSDV